MKIQILAGAFLTVLLSAGPDAKAAYDPFILNVLFTGEHREILRACNINPDTDGESATFHEESKAAIRTITNVKILAKLKASLYKEQEMRLWVVGIRPFRGYEARNEQMDRYAFLQPETYDLNAEVLLKAGIEPAPDYFDRKHQVAALYRTKSILVRQPSVEIPAQLPLARTGLSGYTVIPQAPKI